MGPIDVDLLRPHRLSRWVLPFGFLGLAAIAGILQLLPRDSAGTFFWIARIIFVAAYLGLVGVGMSRVKRRASVIIDATGVYEGGELVVARDRIERALISRAGSVTTLELRAKPVVWLALTDDELARRMLAILDPHAGGATVTYLASTTPLALGVVAWIGIPALFSSVAQHLMFAHASEATWIAIGVPAVLLWLFASFWFMRRRRVHVSPTELGWPRLFGGETHISLGEVTRIDRPDQFTVVIHFSARGAKKLKIYDLALVEDLIKRVSPRSAR